ncbi:MAG: tRNA lysidine(34) synthetase TilS [Bacilli bacterium]|nr:tRNA lysidine(34) synthetase TilS [Bacilli bacterium]MDY6391668.1 tRNA lysidine(34) synthetase TilS [Bacilli bacterium]
MLDYKFSKGATYLCACTYGPDSMALLDMMQKEGIKPIVICINYHKFEESSDDYIKLASYCGARGLTLEYLDAATLPPEEAYHDTDDFKKWARKVRYAFFQKIYQQYNAKGLVIAHQQDDLLEAYLINRERGEKKGNYGMSPVSTQYGMVIIRPLLRYTKEELLEYNAENRVPFSAKKESFEERFTRDPIREKINALSIIERENLIAEMQSVNDEKIKLVDEFNQSIDEGEELEIRPLIALSRDEFAATLMRFMRRAPEEIVLTPESLAEIRKLCLSPNPNASLKLGNDTYLIKEYDILILGRNYDELLYSYTLEKPGKLETAEFDLDFSMGAEDRGITAEDYPLTIRTTRPTDRYVVHGFLEPVHSLYSTWKMPVAYRYVWPIFINKNGKVVYVPRFRRYFHEYHTSLLKLHLPNVEE